MDGMTPYEFFLGMVNNPAAIGIPYQSPGARMNALFRKPPSQLGPMLLDSAVPPTALLPETFDVVYETGEVETFYTGVYIPVPGAYGNLSQVPTLDTPGAAFEAYAIASFEVIVATEIPQVESLEDTQRKRMNDVPPSPKPKQMEGSEYEFDERCFSLGEQVAAFKIEDDIAVLKVENF